MNYKVTCPECQEESIVDQGDGYSYIAKAGCLHVNEVMGVLKTLEKLKERSTMDKVKLGQKISEAESGQLGELVIAFLDVMDSFQGKWYDLHAETGLPEARCKEIIRIANDWTT